MTHHRPSLFPPRHRITLNPTSMMRHARNTGASEWVSGASSLVEVAICLFGVEREADRFAEEGEGGAEHFGRCSEGKVVVVVMMMVVRGAGRGRNWAAESGEGDEISRRSGQRGRRLRLLPSLVPNHHN